MKTHYTLMNSDKAANIAAIEFSFVQICCSCRLPRSSHCDSSDPFSERGCSQSIKAVAKGSTSATLLESTDDDDEVLEKLR